MVESAGITNEEFPVDRAQFQTNRALLSLISDHVHDAEKAMRMSPSVSDSPMGSFGLIPYTERDFYTVTEFSRVTQYSEIGNSRIVSGCQLDKRFVQGAMITSLRMKKEEIADARSYACYDFGNYANVPAE